MKRWMLGLAVTIAAFGLAAATALGGSSYDPLISVSYLQETYQPMLERETSQAILDGLEPALQAVEGRLGAAVRRGEGAYSARDGDMITAARFTPLPLKAGDIVAVQGGSTLILTSGRAKLVSGVLLDLTAGAVCSAGSALVPLHRYLSDATARAEIGALDALGGVSVQGNYKLTPSAAQALPFGDVSATDWFFAAVQYAYDSKLMSGVSETAFAPGGTMTRAMVATVLYRMQGTTQEAPRQFTDVADGVWYSTPVNWAAGQGIVNGLGGGRFGPDMPVTREQLAVMLYRYATWRQTDVAAAGTLTGFPDGGKTADWARQAMTWAVACGIITGRSDGTVDPGGTATRAEVATMLFRFAVYSAAKS